MVDDEEATLELAKINLTRFSIEATTITKPIETLRLLKEQSFDSIVSDYQMPGMINGIQLCEEVRKTSNIPFILYTGRGSEEVASAGFAVGVDDYVRKEATIAHYQILARSIRQAVEKRRAEDALLYSEKRYRQIVENSTVAIYELSLNGDRFLNVNEATTRILGYSREVLLAMSPTSFGDEESRAAFSERIRRKLAGDPIETTVQYTAISKDGSKHTVLLNDVEFMSKDGKPESVVVIASDITELKKVEEKLRSTEKQNRDILESISDGFLSLDRGWHFTYINRHVAENVGRKPEELLGKRIWDEFPGIEGTVHEANYREAMEKGVVRRFEVHGVLTEKSYDIAVYPFEEGISVYWTDVTDRVRAEMELRRSEEKYRSLTKSINEAFLAFDRNWTISYANDYTASLGFSEPKKMVGRNLFEMYPKLRGTLFEENYRHTMETGESRQFEAFGAYSGKWFSMRVFPSDDGIVVLGTDITERKRTEEALVKSNEELAAANEKLASMRRI